MLRVLLLDFNVRYTNPTRSFLPRLLRLAFDLTAFGPGHVSPEVLEKGVEAFVEKQQPFDLVIATEHVVFWAEWLSGPGYRRCYAMDFDPDVVTRSHPLLVFFAKYNGPKLSLLMESDFYNFSGWQIARLDDVGGHYAAWGKEFIHPVALLRDMEGENLPTSATDNWLNFCIRNEERMVSMLHYIAPEEYCDWRLDQRNPQWSVLGAPYAARKTARAILAAHGVKFSGKAQALKVSLFSRLFKLRLLSPDFLIRRIQSGFQSALRDSRYGYTCGAFVRQPIRKFFEIPATGSVLVCQPFKRQEHTGFIDKQNFLACEPNDVLAANDWLSKHPDEAQIMADYGREMVIQLHNMETRASQLADVGSAIVARDFAGAAWRDGALVIRHRATGL